MNALALALLAIEARARTAVVEQIEKVSKAYGGYLAAVIADGDILDGNTLNSRADLHQALHMLLAAAQRNVSDQIRAAYTAAVQLARNALIDEMGDLGHEVGDDPGNLGSTLTALLLDIENSVGRARIEIQNGIQQAFDGVAGSSDQVIAARQLAVNAALNRATVRLRMRSVATVSTGVHQGSRDAQTAILRNYATIHGYATVAKKWVVTSDKPCGMCEALDGSIVGVTEEFDRRANTGTGKLRPVYLDLQGPPRHPNCRCQIQLVVS